MQAVAGIDGPLFRSDGRTQLWMVAIETSAGH